MFRPRISSIKEENSLEATSGSCITDREEDVATDNSEESDENEDEEDEKEDECLPNGTANSISILPAITVSLSPSIELSPEDAILQMNER